MNNFFNIKRFGLVFRKDMMENWKRYTLMFLVMPGVITIVNTWTSYDHYDKLSKHPEYVSDLKIYLMGLSVLMYVIFGLIFSSTFMTPMNSKIKRLSYLIIPSSNFEKYFTRFIIVTVGYTISFIIALFIAELLRVGIYSAMYPDLKIDFIKLAFYVNERMPNSFYFFSKESYIIIACIYFLFQSLLVLGSTFWDKIAFVKTFISIILIIIAYVYLCRGAMFLFYSDDYNLFLYIVHILALKFGNTSTEVIITSYICIMSFFTVVNWILTYFRLRESEIIKRL